MTALADPPVDVAAPGPGRLQRSLPVVARWIAALTAALVIFSVLLMTKGADPIAAYAGMWESTFLRSRSVEQIFIQMAPLVLGALAVAVPARAGLTNVGGEGQII